MEIKESDNKSWKYDMKKLRELAEDIKRITEEEKKNHNIVHYDLGRQDTE